MTNRNATDSSQVEVGNPEPPPPPGAAEPPHSRNGNKVYKSGPLFLSSRGIGWTSWKKRWFILTRTSLVFFRSDPNAVPPKGAELNCTLGGIDLNSSGSVVVKEDKKLITVLFPDGRDGREGRTFTLKAETSEDLHEWKVALEEALADAPNAALLMGQNGIFKNDQTDAADVSVDQSKDRQPVKSMVIGRPVLLALEDIDGTPSFLEKALRFIEEHGVKVEGILRQAADVDDVERRIREYEQGKTDFSSEEDAHVIADCVKYVLRELPSSPVPASCCNALLEACRTDRGMRLSSMRNAICETFPEPNRRLLQRILMMMQTIAAHKAQNRMSISAVAACMAPLLLRPLLAGDCELEHNFDVGGDGSAQLLQAAAAANHAQAICITLLEEYDNLFGEGTVTPELYSETEDSGSESEELTEDDETSENDSVDGETEGSDAEVDDDYQHTSSGSCSEAGGSEENEQGSGSSGSRSDQTDDIPEPDQKLTSAPTQASNDIKEGCEQNKIQFNDNLKVQVNDPSELVADPAESSLSQKPTNALSGTARSVRRPTVWGRTPAKKNLSMESIDLPFEEEAEVQRLEATKAELQNRIAEEAKGNEQLQDSLERRKNALLERRLALEKDVARLQEQLQKERELRTILEAGLKVPQGPIPVSALNDEKTMVKLGEIAQAEEDVMHLKQKTDDLGSQLNQQREQNSRFRHDSTTQRIPSPDLHGNLKDKQKNFDLTAASNIIEKSTRSKHDSHLHRAESDKDKKQEYSSSTHKQSPQNLLSDPLSNPKSAGYFSTTSSPEVGIGRPASINSRKSGARGEGTTSSALSKLTNRINFLKERRHQMENEAQSLDKGRKTDQPVQNLERDRGSVSRGSTQNIDKFQWSEGQSSEKTRLLDSYQSPHSSDAESLPSPDKGKRSEGLPNLERGKSESFPTVDKNRSIIPPRTYSR